MTVYRYSLGDGDSVIIDLPSGDELVVYGDESADPYRLFNGGEAMNLWDW